jgi:hypothetical protein
VPHLAAPDVIRLDKRQNHASGFRKRLPDATVFTQAVFVPETRLTPVRRHR